MSMAKERERVFSFSRFTTMAEDEQEESNTNVYGRIYGASGFGGNPKQPFGNMDDDDEGTGYVEPPRTSYPETPGIQAFHQVARKS